MLRAAPCSQRRVASSSIVLRRPPARPAGAQNKIGRGIIIVRLDSCANANPTSLGEISIHRPSAPKNDRPMQQVKDLQDNVFYVKDERELRVH